MPAFQELDQRYHPDVYRFALFLTGDHARAEDLAADTFVRAWIARERITAATVRAYLFTIAKNLHRDARRRERPVAELPDPGRRSAAGRRCAGAAHARARRRPGAAAARGER